MNPLAPKLIALWDAKPFDPSHDSWMTVCELHFWGQRFEMCEDYWNRRLLRIEDKFAELGFTGEGFVGKFREAHRSK